MGSILQERATARCVERVSSRDREWKRKVSWSSSRPNVSSKNMGRRQPPRKSPQPQNPEPRNNPDQNQNQENHHERRPQRRSHKSNNPPTKCNTPPARAPGSSVSGPQSRGHRELTHSSMRGSKHTALSSFPGSSSAQLGVLPEDRRSAQLGVLQEDGRSAQLDVLQEDGRSAQLGVLQEDGRSAQLGVLQEDRRSAQLGVLQEDGRSAQLGVLQEDRRSAQLGVLQEDSDTDLSDTERLPVSPPSHAPPPLELRPEVMEADVLSSHPHRSRQAQGGLDFPDFLPPPFNSWSLGQLAVFYNGEGRAAPRPRPVGALERYLERLLQLEWHQVQTVQEERGGSAVWEPVPGCRSAAATTSRLSSPKCILQCQRAFPLSFLSSLASHSTLLSGCACTPCQIRYSSCSLSCCRSRPPRLSPMLERSCSRRPTLPPKRSYSESRVLSSERRCSSPGGGNSYLRRMQASGNIRNPTQGATSRAHSSARDSGGHAGKEDGMGGFRRRSGSEQRRGAERQRSGSECRKGRSERREIKADAAPAIMDNLPRSRPAPPRRPGRTKQVEFVT